MEKLLKNANILDSVNAKIIKNVVTKCSTCLNFKRPPPRPAVAFSKTDDFNQTAFVDLHYLERNLWYLHMTYEFTKFSAGAIITSKAVIKIIYATLDRDFWGTQENIF